MSGADDKAPSQAEAVARAVEAAAQGDEARAGFWLTIAAQRRKLGLAARKLLAGAGTEMQLLALRGVPDLSVEWMHRLAHGALLTQGAESWSSTLGGHRVHRYAFRGAGKGPALLLLHGLGGSSSSMAPLLPGLISAAPRIVLLDLPGHGRSPGPDGGPLSAREYGAVVTLAAEALSAETSGKQVALVGNSLGGALSFFAAHERPDLVQGVVGLNPAGGALTDEALSLLPEGFEDENAGAARMAQMLFHKTPWLFWLIARDFARNWGTPTVQRILDDARTSKDRQLGRDILQGLRARVLVLWGAEDRLLPASSLDDFRSIPGARVEVIAGCGHIPQIERPAFTRRRVRDFLTSLGAALPRPG